MCRQEPAKRVGIVWRETSMRQVVSIAGVVALLLAGAGGARAADLLAYSTSGGQSVPVASTQPAYDWSGFYAGVYGAYQHSAASGDAFGLGVDAGVNATFNFALVGAEVAVTGLDANSAAAGYGQALGRAGLLVTDSALLYGTAGYGVDLGAGGGSDMLVGGGIEYAVNPTTSLRAQYLHGIPTSGDDSRDQVTLGAQFHF